MEALGEGGRGVPCTRGASTMTRTQRRPLLADEAAAPLERVCDIPHWGDQDECTNPT